ncbi:MAG: DUF6599 family protein [Pseudomonadota bacterium]
MPPPTEPVHRSGERLAGALVLFCLVGIAAVMAARQLRRPPWREPLPLEIAPAAVDLAPFAAPWVAASPMERYTPATLYEKIDGQAELYLQAGFRALSCQRFVDPEDPAAGVELRLYVMAGEAGARSVQARQARPEAVPLGAGLQGGCAGGACFLAVGAWYLEVLPAGAQEERAREVALAFAETQAARGAPALPLFPSEGLVAGSVVDEVPDAYGLGALDGVATASYEGAQGQLLAWIARGTDGPTRREAVQAELVRLGGVARIEGDLVVVEILGSTCALAAGPGGAAGVQEAADPDEAVALAARLAGALGDAAP